MISQQQYKYIAQACKSANAKRTIARLKHFKRDYDIRIDAGNHVYYAFLRLVAIRPHLLQAAKYKTRKYARIALKHCKDYGCFADYRVLSKYKAVTFLTDDLKLRDEYLTLFKAIIVKLKSMEKQ